MMRALLLSLCGLALLACGEVDQTKAAGRTNRADVPPWQGAKNAYVAKNWSPGDKTRWETQLRTRGQYQNEYLKAN